MFSNKPTNTMQLLVYLALLLPLASFHRALGKRLYFSEENDPENKRYIDVELLNGTIVRMDVMEGCDEVQRDVTPEDVFFDLYNTAKTRDGRPYTFNLNNLSVDTFRQYFDESKNTLILTHGFQNNRDSPFNKLIKDAALGTYDINIIVTDWSSFAGSYFYCVAKKAVPGVGQIVALLVTKIQNIYSLDGAHFFLVGHSLGAHVAGHIGKNVRRKVKYIGGLDPAGPFFKPADKANRLADTDAKYVEVMHTNGALLGMMSAIGAADYYPNGGKNQAGCGWNSICSHSRAYRYFVESIIRGPSFYGHLCSDYKTYEDQKCINQPKGIMAHLFQHDLNALGDYFLKTNSKPPFGRGDVY